MSFGLTFDKLLIIAVLALLLIGPERLPQYAKRLGEWARRGRDYLGTARERMREEVGPEFDDIDWKQLDPRQYDPRRIIREALTEPASSSTAPRESAYAQRQRRLREQREEREAAAATGAPAAVPFDPDAT